MNEEEALSIKSRMKVALIKSKAHNLSNFKGIWKRVEAVVGPFKSLDEIMSNRVRPVILQVENDEVEAMDIEEENTNEDKDDKKEEFNDKRTDKNDINDAKNGNPQANESNVKISIDGRRNPVVIDKNPSNETLDINDNSMELDNELVQMTEPSNKPVLKDIVTIERQYPILIDEQMQGFDCDYYDSDDEETQKTETTTTSQGVDIRQGVDIPLLAEKVQQGEEATSDIGTGSDVVLILGATGVGKSTFIQCIAGHTIKLGWDQGLKQKSYVVDGKGETGFDIGEGMTSETSHVRSFFRSSSSTFYVDTSGYGDNRHIEIDIATSICIRKIASRAKRIRFVVLINAYTFFVHRAVEVRRILQLVANYVGHNFNTFKKSFTFLFTHCNKALNIFPSDFNASESKKKEMLSMMRSKICHLLGTLRKETADASLQSMIKFLRGSLKEDQMFCDVFDPCLSDIFDMMTTVEPGNNKNSILDPATTIKCNLTPTSKMSISQELTRCQEEISSKLEEGVHDGNFQTEVQAVFALANRINDEMTQKHAQAVWQMLSQAFTNIKNQIFERMKNSFLHNEDSKINNEDAEVVKRSLNDIGIFEALLKEFQGNPNLEEGSNDSQKEAIYEQVLNLFNEQLAFIIRLSERITNFISFGHSDVEKNVENQTKLVKDLNLRTMFVTLQKLESWAQTFGGEFSTLCDKAKAAINQIFLQIVNDVEGIDSNERSDAPCALRIVAVLKEMHPLKYQIPSFFNFPNFSNHADPVGKILENARQIAIKNLSSTQTSAENILSQTFQGELNVLDFVSSGSRAFSALRDILFEIDSMTDIIESNSLQHILGGLQLRKNILELVTAVFLQHCELCHRLVDNLDSEKGELLECCFQFFAVFNESLPPTMCTERELIQPLAHLYRSMAAQLREKVGRLKEFSRQLGSLSHFAIDGTTQKHLLQTLRSCIWFDTTQQQSILDQAFVPFVAGAIEEIEREYGSFSSELAKNMTSTLQSVFDAEGDSTSESQEKARFIATSAQALRVVSWIIDSKDFEIFLSTFQLKVKEWCKKQRGKVDVPLSDKSIDYRAIDNILQTAKALRSVDEKADASIDEILSAFSCQSEACKSSSEDIIGSDGNYQEKGVLLDAAAEWSKYAELRNHLPTWEKLRQNVRQGFADHSEKLLKSIQEAENKDITNFENEVAYLTESVSYVDAHIDGEASKFADIVRRTFAARQEDAAGHFHEMIEANDFEAIQKYLDPLKHNKEKEKHYYKCMKILSTYLWQWLDAVRDIIKDPSRSLQNELADLTKRVQVLKSAEKSVGSFSHSLPPPTNNLTQWNLTEEMKTLESEAKDVLKMSTNKASKAIDNFDFFKAFQASWHAKMIQEAFHKKSFWGGNDSGSKVHQKALTLLSRVNDLVDEFLAAVSDPRSGILWSRTFPPDTSRLRKALSQLKNSVEIPSCPKPLVETYENARKKLSTGLDLLHQDLAEEISQGRFCRAIEIFSYLCEELMKRRMEEHVEIHFDVATEAARCLEQKELQKTNRQFNLHDTTQVMEIASQLDRLSRYRGGWYSRDYEMARLIVSESAQEEVRGMLVVIKQHDFYGIRKKMIAFERIETRLGRHLVRDRSVRVDVKVAFDEEVAELSHNIKAAIDAGDLSRLSVSFSAFHALMTNFLFEPKKQNGLPADFDQSCKNLQLKVHRDILKSIKQKIENFQTHVDNFDFPVAAKKGEELRDLGYFLGSKFEAYRAEVCFDTKDDYLNQLNFLIQRNFGHGRFLTVGRSIADLCLFPFSTVDDVQKAFKKQSLRWHPDKSPAEKQLATEKFRNLTRAREILDQNALDYFSQFNFPFVLQAIENIPKRLSQATRKALDVNDYESVSGIYMKSADIPLITSLLGSDPTEVPSADTQKICITLKNMIRRKANALEVDIENVWTKQDFKELHHSFIALESLENTFKGHKDIITHSITSKILFQLTSNLKNLESNVVDLSGKDEMFAKKVMARFALDLIKIGRVLDGFPRLKKEAKNCITSLLNKCRDEPWSISFIFNLGLLLENGEVSEDPDDTQVGRVIVSSFPHFEHVRIVLFNRDVITAPVSESVKAMQTERFTGNSTVRRPIDGKFIEDEYNVYEDLFQQFFNKYVQRGHDELVQQVFALVSDLGPSCSVDNWDVKTKKQLTKILAGVFATFTIIKSGDSFMKFQEFDDDNGSKSADLASSIKAKDILFQPHNVQVLAILSLLGIGDSGSALRNQIMEVRTGEGKSILLGALSVVLALLGFSVRCVCYSEHLSERDNELFQDIFVAFGVENRIIYSKINTMSEDSVAAKGDIRQLTADMINGIPPTKKTSSSSRAGSTNISGTRENSENKKTKESSVVEDMPEKLAVVESSGDTESDSTSMKAVPVKDPPNAMKEFVPAKQANLSPLESNGSEILLVDEVDVFFGPDFYGKTYNQIASLDDSTVKKLLRKLWSDREKSPSFRRVREWDEYKAVTAKFENWHFLIETEVKSMCEDVQNFKTPAYEVDTINARIGYSKMDFVDWDVVYGYRTAFAYLHEVENGTLKGPQAEKAVNNALGLRISCGQFSYGRITPTRILGVSGTLKALTSAEKAVVKDFGVDTYSFLPSVYSQSDPLFDYAGYGIVIEEEEHRYFQSIANKIKDATRANRSAIVFFENDERLAKFQKSTFWHNIRHGNILASTSNKETRNYVIKKAATSGQVTITTAGFGRGTDFFCLDPKLEEAGGMVVIQAFLSIETTEEVQIKGRTARQGKKGHYALVLLESDLCQSLGMEAGEWKSKPHEGLYDWLDKKRKEVHAKKLAETVELVEKADERDSLSRAYLHALVAKDEDDAKRRLKALYEEIEKKNKAKLKFCRMVCLSDATGSMDGIWSATKNCIHEILRWIDDIGEGQFELLWIAYRDYSDSNILEKSCWSKNPKELESFVSNIRCGGGGDYPEAVEWAMHEVNEEHERESVTRVLLIGDAPPHLESRGEQLSSHNNYVMKTDITTESNRLKENGIPVFAFTLTDEERLKTSFESIALTTGGECHRLQFGCSDGAQKLIDCVCETALDDIGGSELVAEYKARKGN